MTESIFRQFCNKEYYDLCAQLGQLTIQKDIIDAQIKEILTKINHLNQLSPRLQELEANINPAQKDVK
jgi:hypothetical protein